ncbi:MAG: hypothetical protein QOJ60_3317 [Actinomycetota bacterium]|nr:hypothetical protein [Actinomycetota bacterium]
MNQPMPGTPPGRYGVPTPARRRALTAAIVVLAGVFGAWLLWAALGQAAPSVRSAVVGLQITSRHHARVRVELVADLHRTVTCQVQALDSSGAVVGQTMIVARTGASGRRVVSAEVKTIGRASRGEVAGCRMASGG